MIYKLIEFKIKVSTIVLILFLIMCRPCLYHAFLTYAQRGSSHIGIWWEDYVERHDNVMEQIYFCLFQFFFINHLKLYLIKHQKNILNFYQLLFCFSQPLDHILFGLIHIYWGLYFLLFQFITFWNFKTTYPDISKILPRPLTSLVRTLNPPGLF